MDERAHEDERTAPGTDCSAEPVARALESPRDVPVIEPVAEPAPSIEPAAPAPPQMPRPLQLQLPRAAGGGAGAVAAFVLTGEPGVVEPVVRAAPEPEPIEASAAIPAEPSPAEPAPTIDHEPLPVVVDDRFSPPQPAFAEATDAAVTLMVEPARAQAASAGDPPPLEAAILYEPAPAEPGPTEPTLVETTSAESAAAEPVPVEQPPQDVSPHPEGEAQPAQAAAHSVPGEAEADPDREQAVPSPPVMHQAQPPLLDLIPQVLPSPPKPSALSPSVAPALRPVQVEPVLQREPDALGPMEPTASPSELLARAEISPAARPAEPVQASPPALVITSPAIAPRVDDIVVAAPQPAVALPLPSRARPAVERRRLRLVLRVALALVASIAVLLLALLVLYRWVDPPASTLMLGQRLAGTPITQRWVPLDRISPNLAAAVISSEDGHFCRHHGVDWGELKEAIESAGDGLARGGSTISMQVVKNLFLWPSRSYLRKAMEIPLAYTMEALWPKRRVLEVYLNIAEWGPGIFGAEAAARYHFRKPALLLTPREAALLAVSLPNPFERQAGRPGPGTARLADNLLLRLKAAQANTSCLRARTDIRAN